MTKIRRTREQWRDLIDGQPGSGLSVQAYCRLHGLAVSGFYLWRNKLAGAPLPAAGDWLSLPVSDAEVSNANWQLELVLPGGVMLRMKQVV